MLSVSYTGKNAYSAGKTSGVLRGGALGANRGYGPPYCGVLEFVESKFYFQIIINTMVIKDRINQHKRAGGPKLLRTS